MSIPFMCPVCQGKGFVPAGFYGPNDCTAVSTNGEPCRSCDKGVLWGPPQGFGIPSVRECMDIPLDAAKRNRQEWPRKPNGEG